MTEKNIKLKKIKSKPIDLQGLKNKLDNFEDKSILGSHLETLKTLGIIFRRKKKSLDTKK